MFTKHTAVAVALTALSTVLSTAGSLQAQTIAGEGRQVFNRSFGKSQVTGTINAFARSGGGVVSGRKTASGADARAVLVEAEGSSQANIFGNTKSLGRISAKAGFEDDYVHLNSNIWTYHMLLATHGAAYANNWLSQNNPIQTARGFRGARLSVELAGKTLINKAGPSVSQNINLPALNLFGRHGVSSTFWVGFIPVVVAANVGVKGQLGVTLTGNGTAASNAVGKVLGSVTVIPNGWVRAGLGGQIGQLGASVGVQGELNLGTTTLRPSLTQTLYSRVSKLDFSIVPISIRVSVYAHLRFLWFKILKTWTVFSWTGPSINGTLGL